LQRIIDGFFRALEFILVACLGAMVVMVLGNVILRYTMNSGIDMSEEMSRYIFVWLTFIGAVVAFREGAHLGVDSLVAHLPPTGKLVCLVLSDLLMLVCCAVCFWGTWQQARARPKAPTRTSTRSCIVPTSSRCRCSNRASRA
jgi:TRAP-type C4-dicarboxylate transport system permease small subunit